MIGLNLAGATWLAIRMAVVEHDAAAGITIALLAAAIVLGNMRAARAADSVKGRRLVRHGKVLLPEDFGAPEPGGPTASNRRSPSLAPPAR